MHMGGNGLCEYHIGIARGIAQVYRRIKGCRYTVGMSQQLIAEPNCRAKQPCACPIARLTSEDVLALMLMMMYDQSFVRPSSMK